MKKLLRVLGRKRVAALLLTACYLFWILLLLFVMILHFGLRGLSPSLHYKLFPLPTPSNAAETMKVVDVRPKPGPSRIHGLGMNVYSIAGNFGQNGEPAIALVNAYRGLEIYTVSGKKIQSIDHMFDVGTPANIYSTMETPPNANRVLARLESSPNDLLVLFDERDGSLQAFDISGQGAGWETNVSYHRMSSLCYLVSGKMTNQSSHVAIYSLKSGLTSIYDASGRPTANFVAPPAGAPAFDDWDGDGDDEFIIAAAGEIAVMDESGSVLHRTKSHVNVFPVYDVAVIEPEPGKRGFLLAGSLTKQVGSLSLVRINEDGRLLEQESYPRVLEPYFFRARDGSLLLGGSLRLLRLDRAGLVVDQLGVPGDENRVMMALEKPGEYLLGYGPKIEEHFFGTLQLEPLPE